MTGAMSPEVLAALEVLRKAFGGQFGTTQPPLTVRQLWEAYAAAEQGSLRSWKRVAICGAEILYLFGDKQASSLTLSDIDRWRAEDRKRISARGGAPAPATRNRTLGVLRHVLNWAVERGLLFANPLARAKLEPEHNIKQTVLLDADVEKLLDKCKPVIREMVLVLFDTGMRCGELLNLRWDQLDEQARIIHLGAEDTKTARGRRVHLSQRAMDALLSIPRLPDSPYIFAVGVLRCMRPGTRRNPNRQPNHGRPYTYSHFQKMFMLAAEASGIKCAPGERITPHSLRHAFISKARRLRLPERVVMAQTGHTTRSAFDRYGGGIQDDEITGIIDLMEAGKPAGRAES